MKNIFWIGMMFLLYILGITFLVYGQTQRELLKSSIKLRSIDPDEEDFSDLEPLKKKIGDARVVSLGEISHSDGASLQAKSRLVKFLHKEMGFQVLAWEAGFLDCIEMNNKFKGEASIQEARTQMMKGGWDDSKYLSSLFKYIKDSWSTDDPLIMAGFDIARPPYGSDHYINYLNVIFEKCPWLKPDTVTLKRIDSLSVFCGSYIGQLFNMHLSYDTKQFGAQGLQILRDSITKSNKIEKVYSDAKREEIESVLDAFLSNIKLTELLLDRSENIWNLARDNFMFQRFMDIYEKLYPGKKVIIWAASGHMMRNENLLPRIYRGTVHFGDYLYNYLGTNFYSIACTTYQGEFGELFEENDSRKNYESREKVNKPTLNSYEYWAHKTGEKYLFTDLRNLPSDNWLNNKIVAYPFGFIENATVWPKIIDAFLFIDTMFPDRFYLRK